MGRRCSLADAKPECFRLSLCAKAIECFRAPERALDLIGGTDIFRQQVIERMKHRLYGDVTLSTALSFWIVAFILLGILTIAVSFAAVSKFARIEPVRGVIVPSTGIAEVRAASTGFLTQFDLSMGDNVIAGRQIGQIITNRAISGDGTRLAAELARLENRIENLQKRLDQSKIVADLRRGALDQEEQRTLGRVERLQNLLSLRKDAAEEIGLIFQRRSDLRNLELISAGTMSEDRLRVISANQQVVELESQIQELTAQIPDFSRKRAESDADYQLTRLQIEQEIEGMEAERDILLSNQSFAVTIPIDGQVSSIFARNGHEVRQGETLLRLLPNDYDLQVELYVPSSAIGFVKEGFLVRMNIDAFPYQEFGNIEGVIEAITTTVLEPNAASLALPVQEPVFRATVTLFSDTIRVDGGLKPLQVGMALTGNIVLEERTLLSHVMEPVLSVLGRY